MPAEKLSVKGVFQKTPPVKVTTLPTTKNRRRKKPDALNFLLCRANQENWRFHPLDYRQTISAKPRKQTSSHSGQISRAP
jgi:hypothetical protein